MTRDRPRRRGCRVEKPSNPRDDPPPDPTKSGDRQLLEAPIYALGVILYERLTGSTPIRRETFRAVALDEMLRVIREVDPTTPSSRPGTSDTLPGLAASRHIDPSRLGRFVRGDLDWIVMKALAKPRRPGRAPAMSRGLVSTRPKAMASPTAVAKSSCY